MNREILFRGKRVDNGEWVYGFFCKCLCDDGTDIPSIMRIENKGIHRVFMQYPIISETRGQYTGKEIDGENLFVGDIVESYEDYDDMWGDSKTGYAKSVVVWDEENFCYAFETDGYIQPFSDWNWGNTKKIGNIHDDSELLKGKENNV